MQNMTICKQFNQVQDALELIPCWNLHCHKSAGARNFHYQYYRPPKVVIRSPDKTGCIKTRLRDILPMSRKRDFAFRTPITVILTASKTPRDFFHCGQFFPLAGWLDGQSNNSNSYIPIFLL
jgi:hypothetical protein